MSNIALEEAQRLQREIDDLQERLNTVKCEPLPAKLQQAYDKVLKVCEAARVAYQKVNEQVGAHNASANKALDQLNHDLSTRLVVLSNMQLVALNNATPRTGYTDAASCNKPHNPY